MNMSDSPISIHKPGTMAQAAVAATAPEGMLIAPVWKRVVGIALDIFLITIVLAVLSQQILLRYMLALDFLLTAEAPYVVGAWTIYLTFCWLYFKYTGRTYGRSLGQRVMRIAIVSHDGTLLDEQNWGKRAAYKLKYVIPVIGIGFGIIDMFLTWRHENKRSPIDLATRTLAAVDWSLPANTRSGLR